MALSEFELIDRFFKRQSVSHRATALGIGDDCALLGIGDGVELAVTMDTLVEGVHFLADVDPEALGHKSLAVNLSDLAAMGALPKWVSLALTLPEPDEVWLGGFTSGFFELAKVYSVELIGGDTTQGPLTITLQVMGPIGEGLAIRRSGAQPDDLIYLTGWLGDAGLGLKIAQGSLGHSNAQACERFYRPVPRVEAGLICAGSVNACIDVSDGLAADLGHILTNSGVGATIEWECLPLSPSVLNFIDNTGDWEFPLYAGDDYELCFTVPANEQLELESRLAALDYPCTRIGVIEQDPGLRISKDSTLINVPTTGFQHFANVTI